MPYKRENSRYYTCRRRRLVAYGDTGRLPSKTTSKRIARDMERLLEDLAQRALLDPSWYKILDAVCKERTLSLPELLRAKSKGRLDQLKRSLHDPSLEEAIDVFSKGSKKGSGILLGLNMLKIYAPSSARLGDLTARAITDLCMQAERDGRKRNSVRRTMLRAISLLLRYSLGNAERDRIFADIQYAGTDDTREVHLSPEEISRRWRLAIRLDTRNLASS